MSVRREVYPSPFGGWDVRAPGATKALAHFATKEEAVVYARRALRELGGGGLLIHSSRGFAREQSVRIHESGLGRAAGSPRSRDDKFRDFDDSEGVA